MTIPEALSAGAAHYQAGRVAEAERIFRAIVQAEPKHAAAMHLLGLCALSMGDAGVAAAWMGRAAAIHPDAGLFYNLAKALARAGKRQEAERAYLESIRLMPDNADAHNNLAILLEADGRMDDAIAAYRQAARIRPESGETYHNLANLLLRVGRIDEAIAAFREALRLKPDVAESHYNLGVLLASQNQRSEAIEAYRRTIALQPDHAPAHNNLGSLLAGPDAVAAFREAIRIQPGFFLAHCNLGNALADSGDLDGAIAAYGTAIALNPDFAEACYNLGNALNRKGDLDGAEDALRNTIQLNRDFPQAYNNLGNILRETRRIEEGTDLIRKGEELRTEPRIGSNLLFTLHYHPDYDAQQILAEHRRWDDKYGRRLLEHREFKKVGSKFRIGYVSPDFNRHPVGRSLARIIQHHDRDKFEIFLYSDTRDSDRFTERLKREANWRDVLGVPDAEVAERIRADGIDILVDLALHTENNRMPVFARRAAPVQVTMLGMPATTGLSAMDYRMTDAFLDPEGITDGDYTERSIRLPYSFWCYEPWTEDAAINDLPAANSGEITFGCFNNFVKVNRRVLELWGKVLQAIPKSRLLIQCRPGKHRQALASLFDPGRVEWVDQANHEGYADLFRRTDICLDPFPYNGHTSSLDALWMGVPVITLSGPTATARGGVSILSNLGMTEFIAANEQEYIEIARRCAADLTTLAEVRKNLRRRLESSPLMDGAKYAADLENAFQRMWAERVTQ